MCLQASLEHVYLLCHHHPHVSLVALITGSITNSTQCVCKQVWNTFIFSVTTILMFPLLLSLLEASPTPLNVSASKFGTRLSSLSPPSSCFPCCSHYWKHHQLHSMCLQASLEHVYLLCHHHPHVSLVALIT